MSNFEVDEYGTRKLPSRMIAEGGGFIDPLNCGSTIMYHFSDTGYRGQSITGTVKLTDCSRIISWEIDPTPDSLKKVERIIEHFQAIKTATEQIIRLQVKKTATEKKEDKKKKKKK